MFSSREKVYKSDSIKNGRNSYWKHIQVKSKDISSFDYIAIVVKNRNDKELRWVNIMEFMHLVGPGKANILSF